MNEEKRSKIDYYLQKLEEFEAKYGKAWVKSKYEAAPKEDGPYYEFAMKMHSAYVYRKTGNSADKELLKQAIERSEKPKVKQEPRPRMNFSFTPQLQSSLSGFNGGRGGKADSPEEFFDKWLEYKTKSVKNEKVRKVVEEAIEKKAEVLLLISQFFIARKKKSDNTEKPLTKVVTKAVPEVKNLPLPQGNYQQVPCEKCGALCDAYYTLSLLTKGLWVRCKNCGNHARPYEEGFKISWKPSKTFIRSVGMIEAWRLAGEMERQGSITSRPDLRIGGKKA